MASRSLALVAAPLLALFALGVACEDQIVVFGDRDAGSPPSSSGGARGVGGFPTSLTLVGGGTTILPTGGVAGGNAAGGFGGAGGASPCGAGSEAFSMEIDRFDGNSYGCAVALFDFNGPSIDGKVVASDGLSLTVDECPPDQSCPEPWLTTVTFSAPELITPMIPTDNFVEIEFDVAVTQGGCTQRLQITNLPIWDGFSSPGGQNRDLWLAAADGTPEPFVDAPFLLETRGFGDCGPDGIDAFALDFFLASDPQTMVEVHQEETAVWQVDLPTSDTSWAVRNLRSYQTGNTADMTNWAYWVSPVAAQPN